MTGSSIVSNEEADIYCAVFLRGDGSFRCDASERENRSVADDWEQFFGECDEVSRAVGEGGWACVGAQADCGGRGVVAAALEPRVCA
jgi:hypothetical protein